ncbi:hypothetical protein AMTRI_Chr09g21880 [Amborella trichopoda]
MGTVELEEQQEKLRRFVDSWRDKSFDILNGLDDDGYGTSSILDVQCSELDPIHVCVEPMENASIPRLVEADNVGVAKLVTVLSYNCFEISKLCRQASTNIYLKLLMFGHRSSSQEMLLEGESQKAFGHSLSLFMEVSDITCRAIEVMGNLLQQLASIYLQEQNHRPYQFLKNATLQTTFSTFGDGLTIFLVLDEILQKNSHIRSHMSLFMRMIAKVKLDPNSFDISLEDLDCLDQVVNQLEKSFHDGFLKRLFKEDSLWHGTLQKVKSNRKFLDALSSCSYEGLSDISHHLDTWKEYPCDRKNMLRYVALFVFRSYLLVETVEKRMGKVIIEVICMAPVIYVEGGIRFVLLDLLNNQLPQSVISWPLFRQTSRDTDVRNYVEHVDFIFGRDWQTMRDALAGWVASFHAYPMTVFSSIEGILRTYFRQIIQGILLAHRLQTIAMSLLDLHAYFEVPIKREKAKSLCHILVLLKVVENTFCKKIPDIVRSLPHIIHLVQADIEHFLLPVKVPIIVFMFYSFYRPTRFIFFDMQDELHSEIAKGGHSGKSSFLSSMIGRGKDIDIRITDSLSLVLIALKMLQGGGNIKRLCIVNVALDILQSIGHVDMNYPRVRKLISKLHMVSDFQRVVGEVTNCSFLYWRKEMMGTWLPMVYTDVNKISWLRFLLEAFCDGLRLLKFGNVGRLTLRSFEGEIKDALNNEIMAPLCRDIETDLRLHVHSTHIKGSVHVNPTKTGVRNLSWYLRLEPLRLPFKLIHIKSHVEAYLDSTFYNHTAMSPYNWKTYTEMKHLAELKYGVVLDGIHLPERSLDLGLDVLDIMRNLHQFAESYMYNISAQVFIERVSSDQGRKTIRIISVDHVASSVATHGLGIIDTVMHSINYFLEEKIASLSEVFQDDHFRSQLLKEYKFWKNDKGYLDKYPFSRAEELNEATGKKDVEVEELSILEQVCSLLTEIGNVVGFAKILQTGSLRHARTISQTSRDMCTMLDHKYSLSDHANYLSILDNALFKGLQGSEKAHLKQFFLVIPALTINVVDSKVHYKDKVLQRGRDAANQTPSDDGFMLGIAYILKLMGQGELFDGLHWFSSATSHFDEAMASAVESGGTEQRKGSGLALLKLWSSSPATVSSKTQKVLDTIKRCRMEMELIEFGVNTARTILY